LIIPSTSQGWQISIKNMLEMNEKQIVLLINGVNSNMACYERKPSSLAYINDEVTMRGSYQLLVHIIDNDDVLLLLLLLLQES